MKAIWEFLVTLVHLTQFCFWGCTLEKNDHTCTTKDVHSSKKKKKKGGGMSKLVWSYNEVLHKSKNESTSTSDYTYQTG